MEIKRLIVSIWYKNRVQRSIQQKPKLLEKEKKLKWNICGNVLIANNGLNENDLFWREKRLIKKAKLKTKRTTLKKPVK